MLEKVLKRLLLIHYAYPLSQGLVIFQIAKNKTNTYHVVMTISVELPIGGMVTDILDFY